MGDTDMLAAVGALLGDPARTRILTALLTGCALTAKELAYFAGVTAPTASSHLSRLVGGGSELARGRPETIGIINDLSH